jgi:hypothetical protein
VSMYPLFINLWMPEPIFMKLGMYIILPNPIWTAYFINPFHQCVCVSVFLSPLSLLCNGSLNTFLRQRIHAPIEDKLDAFFYVVRVVSKDSKRLVLFRISFYDISQVSRCGLKRNKCCLKENSFQMHE